MVNYQLGKIYKIVCNTTGLIYIGSTAEPILARRLAKHRGDYKCYLVGKKHYITSYKVLENENFEIVLLENFSCNTKDELHSRERFYIESNECVNKVIPTRTPQEYHKQYYELNKDEIKEIQRTYRDEHQNEKKKYNKKYHEDNYEKNN